VINAINKLNYNKKQKYVKIVIEKYFMNILNVIPVDILSKYILSMANVKIVWRYNPNQNQLIK
jgi:hypothetical protein